MELLSLSLSVSRSLGRPAPRLRVAGRQNVFLFSFASRVVELEGKGGL
jgi:hypothetical protein